MNTYEEKKIELIELMMEQRSFAELSEGEQRLVEEVVGSALEYDQMRELNATLSSRPLFSFHSPHPDPEALQTIKRDHFSKSKKQTASWQIRGVFRRKVQIRAYQMGVAAVLLVLAAFFFRNGPVEYVEKPVLVENLVYDTLELPTQKDTVYIDRIVVKEVVKQPDPPVQLTQLLRSIPEGDVMPPEEYLSWVNEKKGFSLQEKDYLLTLTIGDE